MNEDKLERLIDAVMTAHDDAVAAAERALFDALGVNPDDPAAMEAFLAYDAAVARMWRQVVALGPLPKMRLGEGGAVAHV